MRTFKRLTIIFIAIFAVFALAACDDDSASGPEVAQEYLEALNEGDLETARDNSCKEQHDELEAGLTSQDTSAFSFENISCEGDDESVTCEYTIEQNEVGDFPDPNQDTQGFRTIIFDLEDNKICGFEESTATR